MKKILTALSLLCLVVPATAQITATLGTPRALDPQFVGINGNLAAFDAPWNNTDLVDATRDLNLGTLRYPGGTLGNYWDWQLGWIDQSIPNADLATTIRGAQALTNRYTLENLKVAYDETGVQPIFQVNILTESKADTIAGLQSAAALGLPVRLIELGNEFYLDEGLHDTVFPDPNAGTLYAQLAIDWMNDLRPLFPDARFAVVGAPGQPVYPTMRWQDWNAQVLAAIDDGAGGYLADAITVHYYVGSGVPVTGTVTNFWGSSAQQTEQWDQLNTPTGMARYLGQPWHTYGPTMPTSLPADLPVWMTEYNLFDNPGPARGLWAQSLFLAGCLHNMLADPRVELTNLHNLAGGTTGWQAILTSASEYGGLTVATVTAEPWTLSASGWAVSLFGQAIGGRSSAEELVFSATPLQSAPGIADYPSLLGWVFGRTESNPAGLVINISPDPRNLDLTGTGLESLARTIHSEAATSWIATAVQPFRSQEAASDMFTAPPYSITLFTNAPATAVAGWESYQ